MIVFKLMNSPRIDSHQHFWRYDSAQYPWIKMGSPLHRDWLPEDLRALQTPLGLHGSIAVQARQSLEESHWLLELAEHDPRIFGVVGWVNLRAENVEDQLALLAKNRRFVGVRHVVQDEPDDRFLLQRDFVRGLGILHKFALRYDLLIFPRQLPAAIALVEQFPEQAFVLDHCAKPHIAEGRSAPWESLIHRLATHQNVYCKVSGLATEARWDDWSLETLRSFLDVIENAFGRDRLMWGSDWPVLLLASGYARWYEVVVEWTSGWSASEQAAFFGGTAARFYGVESRC